ncbi:MAG: hypothetical protein MRY49_00505 [Candidatus Pacebacteria bacterium]|nr:hypothetical protein [Candidatus Paceibacterota bacterium]
MAHLTTCLICGEPTCDIRICNECGKIAGNIVSQDPDLKSQVLEIRKKTNPSDRQQVLVSGFTPLDKAEKP